MRKRSGIPPDPASSAPPARPVLVLEGTPVPSFKNRAAAELGRRGGMKGGAMRAARMTPEERSRSARTAAAVRWAKAPTELTGEAEAPALDGEIIAPTEALPPSPFAKFRG